MTMPARNSHCSYCGARFPEGAAWPRTCPVCGNRSYINPLPVAVALLPVAGGLLAVRRAIAPQLGALALPGGFIDVGEGWREAVARELREETGVSVDPDAVTFFESLSSAGGHLLIFGLCPPLDTVPTLAPNDEVSELVVLPGPSELAFPLHTQAAATYFARRAG
jgi:ADP-ribose pyrophosphatase YjhB (NUDIX family)